MSKSKKLNEAQFLALLQKVLPTKTQDPHLASDIYEGVAKEIRLLNSIQSFEKFCETGAIPDSAPETLADLKSELTGKFEEAKVELTPDEETATVAVEIELPDRTVSTKVKVDPEIANAEEEVKVPFVPFVVSLPTDPELVWVLARREDLGPDEAAMALARVEQEFWETKAGQLLLRDRTERTFAEFIANVPAAMLGECGLKRHYKEPETLKTIRLLQAQAAAV
jgi:hypothetical protein